MEIAPVTMAIHFDRLKGIIGFMFDFYGLDCNCNRLATEREKI